MILVSNKVNRGKYIIGMCFFVNQTKFDTSSYTVQHHKIHV